MPSGTFVLLAEAAALAPRRLAFKVEGGASGLEVVLQPEAFRDEVTVTASSGPRRGPRVGVAQRVNVIGEEEIALRAKAVLAQVANEEVGLHLQRTSPTMAGIFVRGLTGTKVNVFVDGVRYTTSAQRGGVSTFFNLVDPRPSRASRWCAGPRAPSTAATPSAARSSS